jgi:hypothetical protein
MPAAMVYGDVVPVESSPLSYSSTGWGGWSCPADHPFLVNAWVNEGATIAESYFWVPGAETDGGVAYPETPFGYTYGDGETGFIVRNDNDSETITLYLECSDTEPGIQFERYPKNVARCDAEFFDEGQNQSGLSIWVDNAYPSYWCTILADLGNDGTVPVKLQGINWTVELDTGEGPFPIDGINPVDPAQIIEDGGYDLDPGVFPPETAWFIVEGADTPAHDLDLIFSDLEFASCGYQLDPGANPEFFIHVHPYQGAVQGANYRINADFEWVNYNEYRPENAYGCAGAGGGGYEPIDPPADKTKGFAVRYKSMNDTGDFDAYLGVGDLGDGNRSQARWPGNPVVWPTSSGTNFAFDPGAGEIYTELDAGLDPAGPDIQLDYPVAWSGCPAGEFQFMEIFVRDENVSFNGVHINGFPLGDFTGTGTWAFAGDFGGGFHMDGQVEHGTLTSTSNEFYKVEVLVGCAPEM